MQLHEHEYHLNNITATAAQRTGIDRITKHAVSGNKAFLLGDQMGSGKTIQALLAMRAMLNRSFVSQVIVLAPASICSMWFDYLVSVGDNAMNENVDWIKTGKQKVNPHARIILTNYNLAIKPGVFLQLHAATQERRTMLVLDEMTRAKGSGFKPSRISQVVWGLGNVLGLARSAAFTLGLTGTPTPNGRASELHGFMSVAENMPRDYLAYAKKYCGLQKVQVSRDREAWLETANTNMDDWRPRLDKHYLARPLETFAELPPLRRQTNWIEVSRKLQREINEVMDREMADKVLNALEDGSEPTFDEFATTMRLIGMAKVKPAVELARELISDREPLVVLCRHRDVLEALAEAFANYRHMVMRASDNAERRGEIVAAFQNPDNRLELFLSTTGIAAEGITLTRARQSLMVELDCVPGRLDQAEARIHRISQDRPCVIHYMTIQGTIDTAIGKMLLSKRRQIDRLNR